MGSGQQVFGKYDSCGTLIGRICLRLNTLSTPDGTPDARIRFPMRIGEVTRGKI